MKIIRQRRRRARCRTRITVAGLVRDVSAGGADGRGVAVAVDAEVVPRSAWDEVELADGQRVEVVGAIQGG